MNMYLRKIIPFGQPAFQLLKKQIIPVNSVRPSLYLIRAFSTSDGKHNESLLKNQVHKKVSTCIHGELEMVGLKIADAEEMLFPFVWLRDNCQCSNCFHQDSQSRTVDLLEFDINSKPLTVTEDSSGLSVVWKDGHQSLFTIDWLLERRFDKKAQSSWLNKVYRLPRTDWNASTFPAILKRWDYNNILHSNDTLRDWLVSLAIYGVSIVENAPAENTTIRCLAEKVSFIRRTHYGEEFSVMAKPGTTNVAYLSANLQLHTDLPYYHYKPGVNLLHCLVQTQSEGGANKLTDVLAVAKWLKNELPDTYHILKDTVVDWNDIGQEDGNHFHSLHRAPVICENKFGRIERINYSQPQRDSHFNVPLESVKPWYKAMDILTKAIHSDQFCVTYKMKPGEILTFDNIRLVHGRNQYEDDETVRHVIGGYLDWDEVWSRIRVLNKK